MQRPYGRYSLLAFRDVPRASGQQPLEPGDRFRVMRRAQWILRAAEAVNEQAILHVDHEWRLAGQHELPWLQAARPQGQGLQADDHRRGDATGG